MMAATAKELIATERKTNRNGVRASDPGAQKSIPVFPPMDFVQPEGFSSQGSRSKISTKLDSVNV